MICHFLCPCDVTMLSKLKRDFCESFPVMDIIREACEEIMKEHCSGHTECVYEKLLSQYLYERCIPFMTQVDCFVQKGDTQVHVGRIDMEVAHTTIIELKVGTGVKQQDLNQLRKYVKAKRGCGMDVKEAAVVCFRTDNTVEIKRFKM
jgi:GxxExxY protein